MNDLQKRLLKFSAGVFVAMQKLPYNADLRDNKNQLIRSSSSPGAHYGEAQSAATRKDFIYKIGAVLKELRESLYWLMYFREIYPSKKDLESYAEEAEELVKIFATIRKKASLNSSSELAQPPSSP
ncbi:MAG: four helix bundle protein [Bacteroidales bacterium]|jgi:four helix bundle protein